MVYLESLLLTKWTGMLDFFVHDFIYFARPGASPFRIIAQIRAKLRIEAAAVHIPIGVCMVLMSLSLSYRVT